MSEEQNLNEIKWEKFSDLVKKRGFLAASRARVRGFIVEGRRLYLVKFWGMDIHPLTLISLKANLDRTYPKGVHVGEGSAISFDAVILSHDHIRGMYSHLR